MLTPLDARNTLLLQDRLKFGESTTTFSMANVVSDSKSSLSRQNSHENPYAASVGGHSSHQDNDEENLISNAAPMSRQPSLPRR